MNIFDLIFDLIFEKFEESMLDTYKKQRGDAKLDPRSRLHRWRAEASLFYKTYKGTILEKAADEEERGYYEKQFDKWVRNDAEKPGANSQTIPMMQAGDDSPASDSADDDDEPDGNNAALLGPLWFLYHKMYKECALWFLFSVVLIFLSLLFWSPHRKRRKNDPRVFLVIIAFYTEGMLRSAATEWLFKSLHRKITSGFLAWPGYRFRMSTWALLAWCAFYVGVVWEGSTILEGEHLFVRLMSLACFHGLLGLLCLGVHVYEQRRAKRYQKAEGAVIHSVLRRDGLRRR